MVTCIFQALFNLLNFVNDCVRVCERILSLNSWFALFVMADASCVCSHHGNGHQELLMGSFGRYGA